MSESTKMRLLYVWLIIVRYSSPEHPVTIKGIQKHLKQDYGIGSGNRTTITDDVNMLIRCGYPLKVTRSSQNHYVFTGNIPGTDLPDPAETTLFSELPEREKETPGQHIRQDKVKSVYDRR